MLDREEADIVRLPHESLRRYVVWIDDRLGDDERTCVSQHSCAFAEGTIPIRHFAEDAHEQDSIDALIAEGKGTRIGAHQTRASRTETTAKVLQHRWLKVEADQSRLRLCLEQCFGVHPAAGPDLDDACPRLEREVLDERRRLRSQTGHWNVEQKGKTGRIRRGVASSPCDRSHHRDDDSAENPHDLCVKAIGDQRTGAHAGSRGSTGVGSSYQSSTS